MLFQGNLAAGGGLSKILCRYIFRVFLTRQTDVRAISGARELAPKGSTVYRVVVASIRAKMSAVRPDVVT